MVRKEILFDHIPHPHIPRNVGLIHKAEQASGSFNQRVAVVMTRLLSSMWTFWLIFLWIVLWIAVNASIARFDPLPWPLLLTLASVPQLPLAIVIMVGQSVLGRHQELQSTEQYHTTLKSSHDLEQIVQHLHAQDGELLKQSQMIVQLLDAQKEAT